MFVRATLASRSSMAHAKTVKCVLGASSELKSHTGQLTRNRAWR